MSYFISLSLKYMKRNKTRTLYSVFGIILTFILCYVTMSIGYAAWDYTFYDSYLSNPYELTSEAWICEVEDEDVHFNPLIKVSNLKDTLEQLSQDKRVEKISIKKTNYKYSAEPKEIELPELKKTDVITLDIKLKNTNSLIKTAEELSEEYGIGLRTYTAALMYYGQDNDSESVLFLNCILILVASIFGLLSAYILRNTMMIAVTERVRDYGVFRCVGMSDGQLRLLLFAEGITMSLLASIIGVVLGFGGLKLLEPWIKNTLELSDNFCFRLYPMAALYTAILCVAVTLFSLIEPSRLAGKVAPIEALKGIYTAFEKTRTIKRLDKKGGILGRIFKTAGLYAQRNILRKRGGTSSVFSVMFFCIVFILTVFSFTQTVTSTMKNFFKTYDIDYSEYVSRLNYELMDSTTYNPAKDDKICADLEQIENVKETLPYMIIEHIAKHFSTFMYDEKIQAMKKDDTMLIEVGYTKDDIIKEKEYLLDGEIDYDKMVEENGILVCNTYKKSIEKNAGFAKASKKETIEATDFKVGDTVKCLSIEGAARAKKAFIDSLMEVAVKHGINAYYNPANERVPYGDDIYETLVMIMPDGVHEEYTEMREEVLSLLKEKGYDLSGYNLDNMSWIYLLDALKEIEFERGAVDTYKVMGIVSADVATGETFVDSYASGYFYFIYPIDTLNNRAFRISKAEEEMGEPVNDEGMAFFGGLNQIVYGGYSRCEIGIMKIHPEKTDTYIRDYAIKNNLHYMNVYTDLKGVSSNYTETLNYIKIAKVAATMFGGFVILVCLVQIINSLQANMRMRNKEMWLYDVVGMDKPTKFKMVFIEYGFSAVAAFIFGCIASFIISILSVKKILDVTDSFTYVWPVGTAIIIGLAISLSLFSVIWIEINKQKI